MRALLKYVLTPLVCLIILFTLVNSCDRRLDPGISAFIDTAPVGIPDGGNAYFAMVGHTSASGIEPHAGGVAAIAGLESRFLENREVADLGSEEIFGPPGLVIVDGEGLLEEPCAFDCLETSLARSEGIHMLLRENSVLVDRYRDLYRYGHFAETTTLPFLAEAVVAVRETQKAVLLETARLVHEKGVGAALSALGEDIRFWRMVLGGTRRLVNKMVALAALYGDLRLLSEIVAGHEIDGDLAGRIAAVTVPLRAEEKDLSPAMRGECATILELLSRARGAAAGGSAWLVKENATKNDAFRRCRDEIGLYSLRADEWLAQRDLRQKNGAKGSEPAFSLPRSFYNPVGKLLVAIVYPDFMAYPGKVHNLDGYLAMVNVQLGMELQSVPSADIPAYLEGVCPPRCDPFTLTPFAWDGAEGILSFPDPLSGKPRSLKVR